MYGEFNRNRNRNRQLRIKVNDSSTESEEDNKVKIQVKEVQKSKLSFADEEIIVIKDKNKVEKKLNDEKVLFNKNILISNEKEESGILIKVKPIKTINVTNSYKKKEIFDPIWNELEEKELELQNKINIPDSNTIHELKKKRQKMQKESEDIILQDRNISNTFSGNTTSSEESDKRVLMVGDKADLTEDEEVLNFEDDDDNEEVRIWETQQISKGFRNSSKQSNSCFGPSIPSYITGYKDDNCKAYKTSLEIVSFEDVSNMIIKKIETNNKIHTNDELNLIDLNEKIIITETDVKEIERHFDEMRKPYEFYQHMSGYINDLISCYNEKINKLNDIINLIYNSNANKFKINSQLKIGHFHKIEEMINEAFELTNSEIINQVSDYINSLVNNTGCIYNKTLEDLNEQAHYKNIIDELFEDCSPEFTDLMLIFENFENWRSNYRESYLNAYINMSIHKIVSPLIIRDCIMYNPLVDDIKSIDWFYKIVVYSTNDSCDYLLLSCILEHTICPIITKYINILDLTNDKECQNISNLIELIIINPELDKSNQNLNDLISCLYNQIIKCKCEFYISTFSQRILSHAYCKESCEIFMKWRLDSQISFIKNTLRYKNVIKPTIINQVINEFISLYCLPYLSLLSSTGDSYNYCKIISNILHEHYTDDLIPNSFVNFTNEMKVKSNNTSYNM